MNDELIKDLLLHVIYLNSKQLYGVFILTNDVNKDILYILV